MYGLKCMNYATVEWIASCRLLNWISTWLTLYLVCILYLIYSAQISNSISVIGMPEIMCRKHLFDAEAASVADDDDYYDDDVDNKNNS